MTVHKDIIQWFTDKKNEYRTNGDMGRFYAYDLAQKKINNGGKFGHPEKSERKFIPEGGSIQKKLFSEFNCSFTLLNDIVHETSKLFSELSKFTSYELQKEIMKITKSRASKGIKKLQPGSLGFLIHGSVNSIQSISIKMGYIGEIVVKLIVNKSTMYTLLKCGVQYIGGKKKKDIDLICMNEENKTIHYREAKSNVDLDTQKLPATIEHVKNIYSHLKKKYPDYSIDIGIFNWSVYNRECYEPGQKTLTKIKEFEKQGIKVDHVEEILNLLNFKWDQESFRSCIQNIYKIFENAGDS